MGYKRFSIKSSQLSYFGRIQIIIDNETGVNYLVTSGLGFSGITPLIDKNGLIIIDNKIKKG